MDNQFVEKFAHIKNNYQFSHAAKISYHAKYSLNYFNPVGDFGQVSNYA